jgi:hypothetical protein
MKPKQLWTLGAFTLMVAIALGTVALGVLPNIAQIAALENTRVQAREDNLVKLTYLADLKLKAADKAALMVALEKKRQMVPTRLSNVEFMDELKTIADHRQVVVEKFSTSRPQQFVPPNPLKANTEYRSAINEIGSNQLFVSNLSFSLQGTMSDIAQALIDLNTGARYVLINRISIPKADGLNGTVVTADFTCQIFTLSTK